MFFLLFYFFRLLVMHFWKFLTFHFIFLPLSLLFRFHLILLQLLRFKFFVNIQKFTFFIKNIRHIYHCIRVFDRMFRLRYEITPVCTYLENIIVKKWFYWFCYTVVFNTLYRIPETTVYYNTCLLKLYQFTSNYFFIFYFLIK